MGLVLVLFYLVSSRVQEDKEEVNVPSSQSEPSDSRRGSWGCKGSSLPSAGMG